jgi:hypothetical protein
MRDLLLIAARSRPVNSAVGLPARADPDSPQPRHLAQVMPPKTAATLPQPRFTLTPVIR